MKKNNLTKLDAWEKINQEKNIWQYLSIEDSSFYFNLKDKRLFLSSFKNKDLPSSPYTLTTIGKILTKLSTFANIMSKRPGTEEVTFYSMLKQPQNSICGNFLDKKMLNIVSPPIVWRRNEIEKSIKDLLFKYIFEYNESFTFIDIGCGGGFDSLEIERLILGMSELTEEKILPKEYDILNIDIDSKWLKNNKILSKYFFGENSRIKRRNISIFDYLNDNSNINSFINHQNVIISCNGFAEFLSDKDLKKLYQGIYNMTCSFKGKIHIILTFANRDKKQEKLVNKIGFKFRAKEKEYMLTLIKETFPEFNVTFKEKYSQLVLIIEK